MGFEVSVMKINKGGGGGVIESNNVSKSNIMTRYKLASYGSSTAFELKNYAQKFIESYKVDNKIIFQVKNGASRTQIYIGGTPKL